MVKSNPLEVRCLVNGDGVSVIDLSRTMINEANENSKKLVLEDEDSLIKGRGGVLSFQSINYTITSQKCCPCLPLPCIHKQHKRILYNVSGIFKPGMNAILGPTGGGKSSLLDILAGRKDQKGLEGRVLIDGKDPGKDFKYKVGYVVQDDILSGTLTVRENLLFSANLRLSKTISVERRKQIVEQVIFQLGLEKCADSKVGTEFVRGISGGERKRTNIGMELVLSPSLLFLDEPTTGLDSSTARNVMQYLHQLSRRGRTIIFSIHQPRYSILKLFDTIFLLCSGYCAYHGPSTSVLPYFSSIGYECEEHDNPADFLLDITQGDNLIEDEKEKISIEKQEETGRHLNESYMKSSIFSTIITELNSIGAATNEGLPMKDEKHKKSRLDEIFYVSQRILRNVYRNPQLVLLQTVVTIFFAILVGLIYLKVERSVDTGVKNRMGAIFFIVTNQVMSNLSALELFLKERVIFIHEHNSGYYKVSSYFLGKLFCDLIPLRIVPSIIFSSIVYFLIGFQMSFVKFCIFFLGVFLTTMSGSAFCFFLSASVELFGIANLIGAMVFVLMMVFGGFLVEIGSVVNFLSWIKWVSIFRYSTNVLTINEFDGLILCGDARNESSCVVDGKFFIQNVSHIDYENQWDLWKNFVALGSMTIGFLALAYIQLWRMKKTK